MGGTFRYTRFLVTMGGAHATRSDTSEQLRDNAVYVLDLLRARARLRHRLLRRCGRHPLGPLRLRPPNASAKVKALAPTAEGDRAFLVERGDSIYFEGAIESDAGQSCPPGKACRPASIITFRWGFPAGTSLPTIGRLDGNAGFAVPWGAACESSPPCTGITGSSADPPRASAHRAARSVCRRRQSRRGR